MENKKRYFFIEMSHLTTEISEISEKNEIYSFNLYVYENQIQRYSIYLHRGSPLNLEKRKELKVMIDRGGKIAIALREKKNFLEQQGLTEQDIEDLAIVEEDALITEQKIKIEKFDSEKEGSDNHFNVGKEVLAAINDNNYERIYKFIYGETLHFDLRRSPGVSLAAYLVENLMLRNNNELTNRICALAFLTAKGAGHIHEIELSDIIVASYFHHLGFTQLATHFVTKAHVKMSDREIREYRKHPMLAIHLIRTCGMSPERRVMDIIGDHHERADGRGYPLGKKEKNLNIFSLILGGISHSVEFSEGFVTGEKMPLDRCLRAIKDRIPTKGLDMEFGAATEMIGNLLAKTVSS